MLSPEKLPIPLNCAFFAVSLFSLRFVLCVVGMLPLSKAPDSGDEIEATPPTCTKKKRLKARKLVQENRASTKQREEADTEEWEADSSTTIDPAAAAEGTGDVDVAKGAQCDPIPHPAATSGRHIQGIRDMTGSRTTEPTSGVRDGDDNGSNRDTGGVRPAAEVTKEKTAFDDSEESAAPPPAGPSLQIDAEEPIAGDKQPAVADYHDGARTNAGESVADVKAKGADTMPSAGNTASRPAEMKNKCAGRKGEAANVDDSPAARRAADLSRRERASKIAAWHRWSAVSASCWCCLPRAPVGLAAAGCCTHHGGFLLRSPVRLLS